MWRGKITKLEVSSFLISNYKLQSHSNQNSIVLAVPRSMKQNLEPRNKPTQKGTTNIFNRGVRTHNGEMIVSLIDLLGKLYSHMQKNEAKPHTKLN